MEIDLKNLFFRGLIVAPEDTQQEFEQRVGRLLPLNTVIDLEGIRLDWVTVSYSRKGLRFWEGGCTWIGPKGMEIQLHPTFENKETLYKIYSKSELLQHEAVHALRVGFHEPQFEEFLAYQTSKFKLRRVLGPIFRSPKESLVFVVLLALFPLFPLWMGSVLASLSFLGIWRLFKAHQALKVTKEKLERLTSQQVLKWLLALTDAEIWLFAEISLIEILQYIQNQKSLRWKQLRLVFLDI
ncbi:MAG: hypothetical protein JSS62_03250 [Verrucomicrobia bacterium]|nr:hypothetical protein [Verrucomicrobiota bacterium]MBS0646686.1 hypothetical protein [Verrucomicrobiota bacterium]